MSRKLETLADLNVGDYLWFEGELREVAAVEELRRAWSVRFAGEDWADVFEDGPVWLVADDADMAELRRVEVLHFRAAARMWFAMTEAREGSRRALVSVGLVLP